MPTSTILCCPSVGLRHFRFHRVFDSDANQRQVYDVAGRSLVSDFMNGRLVPKDLGP